MEANKALTALRRAMMKRYTIWDRYSKLATTVDFDEAHQILAERYANIEVKPVNVLLNASLIGAIKVSDITIVATASWQRHPRTVELLDA